MTQSVSNKKKKRKYSSLILWAVLGGKYPWPINIRGPVLKKLLIKGSNNNHNQQNEGWFGSLLYTC